MPFKFKWLVQLLENLQAVQRDPQACYTDVVNAWFTEHDDKIERNGPSAVAFLSCLFPERLPHRNYGIREHRLINVLARICGFASGRLKVFQSWKVRHLDFAECFEELLAQAEMSKPPDDREVTLEEINVALLQLAANSGTATLQMRAAANNVSADDLLRPLVRRLHSTEAKWLVRMILKNYSPVLIPEHTTFRCFHFLLPYILRCRNSFEDAVEVLGDPEVVSIPYNPPSDLPSAYTDVCTRVLTPKLGSMVKRNEYEKARSIKHCMAVANRRLISAERKYDGEYCQVHIDKTKGRDCIQIFSKSGKDSTEDRIHLHGALEYGLRLHQSDCAFTQNCVVEGELLVWSRSKRVFQPFHVIRKHVMHGGKYRGIDADSPKKGDEAVMIVFYDLLLLDNKNLTAQPHSERRKELERIVQPIEGLAQVGQRQIINFGAEGARDELLEFLEHAIEQKWEGLVLKGCADTYLSWDKASRVIKLKKDLMGLGDVADLCVVGGRRDQIVVDELKMGPLEWTSFYVACLENKEEVRRFDAKPTFRILSTVSNHSMSKETMRALNQKGHFQNLPFVYSSEQLDVRIDQPELRSNPPTHLFKDPFVVELTGGGFHKPQNTSYFVLRFPRDVKLHEDRTIVDTHTFQELQDMAEESLTPREEPEEVDWQRRLIGTDGKNAIVAAVDQHAHGTPSMASTTSRTHPSISPSSVNTCPLPPESQSPLIKRACTLGRILKRTLDRSSLSPVANKRVKPTPCERSLIPLHSVTKNPPGPVHPYDPPAVFRSPSRLPRLLSNKTTRRPLSEISNVSPQRGLDKGFPHPSAMNDQPNQKPGRVETTVGPIEKQSPPQAVKVARANTPPPPPPPQNNLDNVVKAVLGPSLLGSGTCQQPPSTVESSHQILIHLVDKDLPNVVANVIGVTVKEVLKFWAQGRRSRSNTNLNRNRNPDVNSESAEAETQTPKATSQRMILFYDETLPRYILDHVVNDDEPTTTTTTTTNSDGGGKGGRGYSMLFREDTRLLFAGCLVFSVDVNPGHRDEVVWKAIFNWHTAMDLLRDLHSPLRLLPGESPSRSRRDA